MELVSDSEFAWESVLVFVSEFASEFVLGSVVVFVWGFA